MRLLSALRRRVLRCMIWVLGDKFIPFRADPFLEGTDNPLYTDTRCNDKIHYNDNFLSRNLRLRGNS